MSQVSTTRPPLGPSFTKAVGAAVVMLVIGAGAWIVIYGLPKGEAASWWVLIGTVLLLTVALVGWRYVDLQRLGLLQRCLILSALVHVLIAAGFSVVVVVRQVAQALARAEVLTPTVNLNLSRELEVREQVRQQVPVDLPIATPVPSLMRQDMQSPLPPLAARLEPVGITEMPWRQRSAQQLPVAPTVPMAPPSVDLVTPLLPVQPEIIPLPELTPIPASAAVDTARDWSHPAGPLTEQLAPRATSPVGGAGPGSLGAPPAMLETGPVSGGTATGSGTGRPLALLTGGEPLRPLDLPLPTVALPPPSSPEFTAPHGPAGFDALGQRAFDQRQKVLEKYGGTPETEAAVARALLYLSRIQQADGHWSRIDADGSSKGTDDHDVGLTGLALLCYLAANHTPDADGPYRDVVKKGMAYLLAQQKTNGDLRGAGSMYDHGIATLALGEAAAMTRDKKLRDAAHHGAQFCLDAQNGAGAWRYAPGDWFTDTSVTGWQVMALHSAERTGFKVSAEAKLKVAQFLGTVSKGPHGMLSGYLTASPTLTMTAEGVFTRMLLGQQLSADDLAEAAAFLTPPAPQRDRLDYYYVYYGSLALMQMQGDPWQRWNAAMTKLLLPLQEPKGLEAGSFPALGEWADRGGKVYTTALSTLSLEVYYRYLPMYAPEPAKPRK